MSDHMHSYRDQVSIRPARRVNHKLHFWLTILSGGAWGIVWIALAATNRRTEVTRTGFRY